MIERTIVQVVGPPGAGKILLIERLLRSNRARSIGVLRVAHGDEAGDTGSPARSEIERAEAITRLLEQGMPIVHSGRWLRAGWEDLADAELAVVNARAEHGHAAARATLRSLEALRTDERWHATLVPRRRDPGPRRSLLVDLTDSKDRESRRLIETIKRRWR